MGGDGASDGGYEDEEWEDEQEEEEEGLVYPLPHDDKLKKPKGLENPTKAQMEVESTVAKDDGELPKALPGGELAHGTVDEEGPSPASIVVNLKSNLDSEGLVRLHAQRKLASADVVQPPPAPVSAPDIGTRGARAAQERVRITRQESAEREEQDRREVSAQIEQRKQIRLSNKPYYRRIGAADMTADQRLQEWKQKVDHERKQEEDDTAMRIRMRRAARANHRSHRSSNGANYGEAATTAEIQSIRSKRQQEQRRKAQIKSKLAQLSLEAKTIINRHAGEYEKGSFLLKTSTRSMVKAIKEPEASGNQADKPS
ncbi:hypothetical protein Poli38472_005994 [Pythium oligandrum]|uniref:Uncharacterized protein n=1 Tax=Pythium oligandrum TaxID=41045 RepID=A0A8K1CRK9_PYTOL|nr:hypothetical protein Poli38472_005994 [Pythium oligandrum]|eukprot:TMW68526.1 hypothetical protein Poli38472_005994 [Pythium oligandrum]